MQLHSLQKQPNLKLKTHSKQLLGYLPLAFALPKRSQLYWAFPFRKFSLVYGLKKQRPVLALLIGFHLSSKPLLVVINHDVLPVGGLDDHLEDVEILQSMF